VRLLIVEDEADLARALRMALEDEGFAVDVAPDGTAGLRQAEQVDYDVVLLDLMLPGLDGRGVLSKLREEKGTPVLVLTARDGVQDKIDLLNLGADDYLTKPFDLDELIARVRALIRRNAGKPNPMLQVGEIELNTTARTVTKAGEPVTLSPKEYSLVELLVMHRGELVTRTMIYDHCYDDGDDSMSNVVDVFISNIRKKLGKAFVRTRRGEGYIVDA
jgi:two-component system OmpR family response regulator